MKDIQVKKLGEILQVEDFDCVIVDKVFASCQHRECFPEIEVELKDKVGEDIKFASGFIVPGSLTITDLDERPNFKRVRFKLRVPFRVLTKCGNDIEDFLPDISRDIVMYHPDARDEFQFKIVVETASEILGQPVTTDGILTFAVGIFVIIKVVGKVQLMIPSMGYCPEPDVCEEFSPEDICDNFDEADFPDDFFPPQLENNSNNDNGNDNGNGDGNG